VYSSSVHSPFEAQATSYAYGVQSCTVKLENVHKQDWYDRYGKGVLQLIAAPHGLLQTCAHVDSITGWDERLC
jgi:hypothetical protein